ncbi:FKBP-type peptidyl-prolyl cis-trans isomerase SlyD [Thioalkalivibrio nitratireducens DSM 14787]|uniref:Peptidyl-prolyl cis-trans isomerase n=1 Tax=Thioalkalivibrio nitratireducens (strain DSM 14787 / UNIQEM 213 / ALEN2) TaxID=1255043 RepID=L0DVG9_THIND|nr:peptidylprolyl isomerase [Thioalkalivibrio nitratireducens]AGA32975.1 FKBP-type peptidyl-prolyl cis-trans isomerase SlyD [Thioalkalivibrio nitratireducens DSM 14787]
MQISANKVVSIDYTLTNDQGQVLDTSEGREPMAYLQGHRNIISGLESALEGKSAGDRVQVTVAPEQAYGERNDALRQAVPRTMFEDADQVQVGMQFQTMTEQGAQVVTVTAVDAEHVTVDANHPLAGETLTFDVTIVDVREASEEELEHGHVHGPGGHQH